jgi:pimeloyl-ACP methyl ester carboxylesterase
MKRNLFWAAPLLGLALLLASFTLFLPKMKTKKTFVLVHGAWAGNYAWTKLRPLLEKDGNKVISFDLPAHGDDQTPTPLGQITVDSYVQYVTKIINAEPGKVVLVGHSMGGIVISQVAEAIPNKIEKLVYLSAYLPKNGDFVFGLKDTESLIPANLVFAEDKASATLKPEAIVPIFAADCPADVQALVVAKHRPEPAQPFMAKAVLTDAHFGKVPKYYIKTLKDKAVGPLLQQQMIEANGHVAKVFTIDCGHSAYFAKPTELAAILNGL